jgi:hypothetical protein
MINCARKLIFHAQLQSRGQAPLPRITKQQELTQVRCFAFDVKQFAPARQ